MVFLSAHRNGFVEVDRHILPLLQAHIHLGHSSQHLFFKPLGKLLVIVQQLQICFGPGRIAYLNLATSAPQARIIGNLLLIVLL